ncbi:hypothetical protein [Gordonia sp. NPDC003376]
MIHPEHSSHHRRRTLWVLGVVAFLLLAALTVAIVYVTTTPTRIERGAGPAATVTMSADTTAGKNTPGGTPPPDTSTQPPVPAPTDTVTETATREFQSGSVVAEGSPCFETEARSFGTAADGTSLVCIYVGAGGGYRWVQHAEDDGSVHNIGDPCDSSVDRVARDPEGRAIMCGGDTWVAGP